MTTVTSPYRRVLATPGAMAFSATGLVARLPISMITLGIVVLVSMRTGSYGEAGGISAAYVAATAVGAVPLARYVDRLGQGRVLGAAVTFSVTALVALITAVELGWSAPWPHVFAVLSGATMPNVGAAVRARWSHAVSDRSLLDTAFAVEAVNDEVVFILGPTLVTLLATAVHPIAGLGTAGVAALAGTWALVAQRRTEPPSRSAAEALAAIAAPMPWGQLLPMVAGAVMLGVVFGGTEVAVVAFADERGTPGAAGLLLAAWALGSLLSGVVSGHLTYRRDAATRYRLGILALALLMVPLPFLDRIGVLGVFLFLAGFAISPTMIAAVSWVESVVPSTRLNEGMTVFSTGLIAGVAPGAAVVGTVVDSQGASASFWVGAAAGLLGAAAGLVTRRTRRSTIL
jgi:predicted MFS family arabinose efflux permease